MMPFYIIYFRHHSFFKKARKTLIFRRQIQLTREEDRTECETVTGEGLAGGLGARAGFFPRLRGPRILGMPATPETLAAPMCTPLQGHPEKCRQDPVAKKEKYVGSKNT